MLYLQWEIRSRCKYQSKYFLPVHQKDTSDELISPKEHHLPDNTNNLPSYSLDDSPFHPEEAATSHISLHALI